MRDLTAMLDDLATLGEPRGATEVFRAATTERSQSGDPGVPRRRVAFVVALAFVLVLAGIAIVIDRTRSDPTVDLPVVTPSPLRDLFDTSNQAAPPGVRYLVPTYVPAGMQPVRIQGGDHPGVSAGWGGSGFLDRFQTWTRLDAGGTRPVASFLVGWGRGATTSDLPNGALDDALAGVRDRPQVPVRGRIGYLAHGSLTWEEPKARLATVSGTALTSEELIGVADALQPRPGGGFDVTRAPAGFVEVAEGPGMAASGANLRELVYRSPDGPGFRIVVGDDPGNRPGSNLTDARLDETNARLVRVRGRHAVAATSLSNNDGGFDGATFFLQGATTFLQWFEPGNVEVTISGIGMTERDLLSVANGLRVVDRAEWIRMGTTSVVAPVAQPGERPPFSGIRAAVARAYTTWLQSTSVAWVAAHTEAGAKLGATLAELERKAPKGPYVIDVTSIRLSVTDRALVRFDLTTSDGQHLADQVGEAVLVDGRWLVARSALCALTPLVGVQCPAG